MSPHEDLFHRLLDESSSLLAAPAGAGISIPDDELHRDIIVPLLPAMLADAAIRGHWREQHATGFVARISRHFENGDAAPRWTPDDFEIHVTASYSAGPDARALADTLLSEDSLRDMTAALMNQILDVLWSSLAAVPTAFAEPETAVEIAQSAGLIEVPETVATAAEIHAMPRRLLSCALVRSLCRNLGAAAVRRGLVANCARAASSAVISRRILNGAARIVPRRFASRIRRTKSS